ncbi:hypothetical protein B0H14DRAFT_3528056 [Mycena olivaceomarginata]|nr:hypothetical protein B0H14DRAFT_3528056 [Mycena olivaceomarginata]
MTQVPQLRPRFLKHGRHHAITLLFRSVGAFLFEVLSDRFGRKWLRPKLPPIPRPALAVRYVLGSRSLFYVFGRGPGGVDQIASALRIGMGGIWGFAASTALENLPVGLRGLPSGLRCYGRGRLAAESHGVVSEVQKTRVFPAKKAWCAYPYSRTVFTQRDNQPGLIVA